MRDRAPSEITRILHEWNGGSRDAQEELVSLVYDELKIQARSLMSGERTDHTLQPTALVHETFLRLEKQAGFEWKNRRQFYGITSRLMRQILIDHARKHSAAKRGSRPVLFSLEDVRIPIEEKAASLLALDEALERLARLDEQQARIVEMRFFGGLSNKSIADVLDMSERTVCREWTSAKLWLFREVRC